jgi:hypothetical protein
MFCFFVWMYVAPTRHIGLMATFSALLVVEDFRALFQAQTGTMYK